MSRFILTDNPNSDPNRLTYIAGGMTQVGPPTWNYPAFACMARTLRDMGWLVISPHELHEASAEIPHDWYMRRDITELVKCGRIVMLDGWEKSRGAKMEFSLAVELGMDVWYQHQIDSMSRWELEALA